MHPLQSQTIEIIKDLQASKIDPILYGSQGISLYLGPFKKFGDIDLLVSDRYMNESWPTLVEIMSTIGFKLLDLHEHEFINDQGLRVGFASEDVLIRDGIIKQLEQVITISTGGLSVRTLSANDFRTAYQFSRKDGYRKEMRGKNDQHVIDLLEAQLQS